MEKSVMDTIQTQMRKTRGMANQKYLIYQMAPPRFELGFLP
jgi:hypothetical protein